MPSVDKLLRLAQLFILSFLVGAVIVGMIYTAAATGPNCPAPVPANWLGFCDAYPLQ